jgi:hypothetical protein
VSEVDRQRKRKAEAKEEEAGDRSEQQIKQIGEKVD